jgi:hypothetical protein
MGPQGVEFGAETAAMNDKQSTRDIKRQILAKQADFARGYSPLYAAMLDHIGSWLLDPKGHTKRLGTPKLVEFCARIEEFIGVSKWNNELEPTLRLGACLHAFVLDGDPRVAELAKYYKTVGGEEDPQSDRFEPILAAAVTELGDDLVAQAEEWRVRTNETSRGIAWLLPAALVGAEAAYLVELGASAGLNLYAVRRAWDLAWEDGTQVRLGQADAEQFRIEVEGQKLPDLSDAARGGPEVLGRVGCDTDPVDLADPSSARVLSACVWGDQSRRMRRLREGLELHQRALAGELGPMARVEKVVLPDEVIDFVQQAIPRHPVAPVICFNTYVTAYLNDVDHRALARRLGSYARAWSLQHHLPWMWVRFEPARSGEGPPPAPGWCRWRVDLWEGSHHHRFDLGWAHPHLVRAKLGPGLLALAKLQDPA